MTLATIERMDMEAWLPPWVRSQHLARYDWARQLVRDKVVLDAACGSGYGSAKLIQADAHSVTGLDVSEDTVAVASETYQHEGLIFVQGSVTALPHPSQSIDVYVSFETIEHVQDDRAILQEARRVLAPEGMFLCSTPNRTVTNPGTSIEDPPFNRHHIREYSSNEFATLLLDYFSYVTLYGQTWYSSHYVQALVQISKASKTAAQRLHQVRKLEYLVHDHPQRHYPIEFGSTAPKHCEPEFLVAVCRP